MNLRRMAIAALVVCVLLPGLTAGAGQKSVLIYGKTLGFRHGGAIDKGNPILKTLAEGLGYKATISEDPVVFDDMSKWDLIIYNNCTGQLNPKEESRREAPMKRIKEEGAGFMGFHAATDCNYKWPEYGKMINGYFSGHPWNQEVRSKVEDPDHPLMKAFGGGGFVIRDEIYQFRDYERGAARILMSIDNSSVPIERGKRQDRDYAICWIRPWGKGRVYYNAHGHGDNVFRDKTFQEHLKPAMQWAIGDIDVDTTPSKPIDTAALAAKAVATLKVATTDKERLTALGTLTWCPREDALPLVVAQFDTNQQVAAMAAAAAAAILAKSENVAKPEQVAILKKALPLATDRSARKAIRDQLRGLGVTDIPINVPPGYIAHWFIAGPIPGEVEAKEAPKVDLAAGLTVDGKTYPWKKVETDDDGILDLNANLKRSGNVHGYMLAEVTVEEDADVEMQLGSDDGFVLFVNGTRIAGKKVNRGLKPGSDKAKAKLNKGANQIILEVIQGGGDWAGCLQIVGADGKKLTFTQRKK